jgi:tripartite-type tricarboxylate transporter receptor subunit TctC
VTADVPVPDKDLFAPPSASDCAPVAGITRVPVIMVLSPSVPSKTVPEFTAYAKANPGKLTMASGGVGTPSIWRASWFKTMTGVDMLHVPYRGTAPSLTDLFGSASERVAAVTASARSLPALFRSPRAWR